MKKLSAVVACYKDEKAIPEMYERLKKVFLKIKCDYEIIFVNDGSPDNSEKVINSICLQDEKCFGITHTRNFNSQNAFTSGMMNSTGDAVILLDGDLQDPPEIIEEFFKKWKEGYEVVYGVRKSREENRIMNFFYKLFYRILNKVSFINIPLDAGDFSMMDRRVVNSINQMTETDRYIRGLRAWVGYKQIGVNYFRPKRKYGKSTNNFFKNIGWAKKGIFSYSYIPLEFFSYFSLILVFLSFIAIIFYFVSYFLFPDQPKGITTVIVLVLFIGGVQLLSISILAEYISKIFEETKNRPNFIIKKIINYKKNDQNTKNK